VQTEISADAITARRGEAPKDTVLDIRQKPEFLPLAVSIIPGLMRQNREQGSIFMDTGDTDVTSAQECLENAGLSCRVFPNRLEVSRSTSSQEKGPPWECPTPWWCLAYALISFSYRGLCLANPGILTSVWPKFWKIFTSLPEPQNQFESLESKGNEKTKRRRIIVG
jgi:3-phosphoshikimate 1-carboxyvinyltransferase